MPDLEEVVEPRPWATATDDRYCSRGASLSGRHGNENRAEEGRPSFPRITNHTLRRTYISLLFAAGAEPPYVMGQVGHDDANTTLNIYAQVLRRHDRTHVGEAFDRLMTDAVPAPGGAQMPSSNHERGASGGPSRSVRRGLPRA